MLLLRPASECHTACKTCDGPTSQDCDECKEGWEEDDQEACVGKRKKSSSFTLKDGFKIIVGGIFLFLMIKLNYLYT